ncbi:MAG: acetolactate decarboxylase [Saprospiraceae bacterium]|nr:acetolactate decarboxylase [Saprospiraceae bacterium]
MDLMKFSFNLLRFSAIIFILTGCGEDENMLDDPAGDGIFQISTLDALAMGDYYAKASIEAIRSRGDFGLGTYVAVEGEMVILDDVFYQVKDDGVVYEVSGTTETPFAAVKHFQADTMFDLDAVSSLNELTIKLDQMGVNPEEFYAIRIQAELDSLVVRSVHRQNEPYPPLSAVVADQVIFPHADISGTLVGFYFPLYSGSINAAGYHFHFISDDRTVGGHVLDCRISSGKIEMDRASDLQVNLGPL